MLNLLRKFVHPANPITVRKAQICIRHLSSKSADTVLSVVTRQLQCSTPSIKLTNWPYHLRVCPNDILDPSDVLSLRASIVTSDANGNEKASTHPSPIRIEVDADTKRIQIHHDDAASDVSADPNLTCVLEVPVQSELDVSAAAQRNIHVERLYSDAVRLRTSAGGNISTHNLNGFRFEFETHGGGSVRCGGNTLANHIEIRAHDAGTVHLAKMQGDLLFVLCDTGAIRTESCYTEASKFVTHSGLLELRNVHKFAEMFVLQAGGRLEVSGFHGRLVAKVCAGAAAKLQLTELYGESSIEMVAGDDDDSETLAGDRLTLNVSDFVLDNNELDVGVSGAGARVRLAETLADSLESEWWECISPEADALRRPNPNRNAGDEDRLLVRWCGDVLMGKMTWTDTLKLKFNVK